MTDRERWIVYPLLFLTLGIAIRDKLFRLVNVDNVRCNRLVLTDAAGRDRVAVFPGASGGMLQLEYQQNEGSLRLGHFGNVAGVFFVDSHGQVYPLGISKLHGERPPQASPKVMPQESPPAGEPEAPPEGATESP